MSPCTTPRKEAISTSTPPVQLSVLVVKRHHLLVRWSHWLNVPILLGLILSGISIYWSLPIYQHKPDPLTGNFDMAADIGIWICAYVPGLHRYSSPPDWVYNHFSVGPGNLAVALRLHWLSAYAFMLNGWAIHKPCNSARWPRSSVASMLRAFGISGSCGSSSFCPPCDFGFRRRLGYVPRHDRRLVGASKAIEGHG